MFSFFHRLSKSDGYRGLPVYLMFIFVFIVYILFALGAVLATTGASSGVTSTVSDESLEKIIALFQSQLQQDLLNASEKVILHKTFIIIRVLLNCLSNLSTLPTDHPKCGRLSLFKSCFMLQR